MALKDVEMVNKFAQLEFKYGEAERAKTMYDSLLSTYPNRTDIWSVYTDMLVKAELYDDVRFDISSEFGLVYLKTLFQLTPYTTDKCSIASSRSSWLSSV